MACRCETGNCPPDNDALHMCVRYGSSTSRTSLRMNAGTGSSEHDFVGGGSHDDPSYIIIQYSWNPVNDELARSVSSGLAFPLVLARTLATFS